MKKLDRNLSFTIMGLVALVMYMILSNDPNTPMSLKLSLGTLAVFLFLMAIMGYLRKRRPPK
ncbi:MAG TPA: hypothetical protein GXZ74_08025 [Tissierellia bacterium]|nr:hypothetical protein [Tissierellia bacterium]